MAEADLTITNDIGELETISRFLEQRAEEWELDPKTVFTLNLVLEEMITNIIFYGFDDIARHEIHINMQLDDRIITLIITDDGIPFDPFVAETPADLDKPAEERKIGGLGIYFVKEMMDSYTYQRIENNNRIVLSKKVK
jgi:anti-sigma regulatory factor (Ser/Thr protein kinase)